MLECLLAEGRNGISLQMCLVSTWHRTMFMTSPLKLHDGRINGTRPGHCNHTVEGVLESLSSTIPVLVGKFR